ATHVIYIRSLRDALPISDGMKVGFVFDNDLYYRDLTAGTTVRVTHDGKYNHIINGNCDWVYEEEFSFTRAFQWSPDSRYIAWYRSEEHTSELQSRENLVC